MWWSWVGRAHQFGRMAALLVLGTFGLALLFPAAAFWARGFEGWLPWPAPLAAFLFFRLFDIWKPWLVGRADAKPGWQGVMLDDLWAGLFAGIATLAAAGLAHGVLM